MTFNIGKYYEEVIANLPVNDGGVYVGNLTSKDPEALKRGKSLFASKKIEAGDVVFVERSIVNIIDHDSSKFVKTCDYCMRALGTVEDQVKHISRVLRKKGSPAVEDNLEVPYTNLVREYAKERITRERKANNLELQTDEWPIPDHIIEVPDIISCEYGSGDKYCSVTCRNKAFNSYNKVFVNHLTTSGCTDEVEESKEAEDIEETNEGVKDVSDLVYMDEETLHKLHHKSPIELTKSLKNFSKETNPMLFLACRVVAVIAAKWENSVLAVAQKKVEKGEILSLLEVTAGSAEPVVTLEESAEALYNALSPFLLFSQAPWWNQVQEEEDGNCPCDDDKCKSKPMQDIQSGSGSGNNHAHEDVPLQEQIFDLVQTTSSLFTPILLQFEKRVKQRVNVQTITLQDEEIEPDTPPIDNEAQLMAFVNNISQRQDFYKKMSRYGVIALANSFTIGCFMGMFEMNNIGTVVRSAFLDYVEFVAGELDSDDLEEFRLTLHSIYEEKENVDGFWKDNKNMKYNTSSPKQFIADLKNRKLELKKHFTPTRWANLLKRAQEHPVGSGLYAVGCCMNHSCSPNVIVMKLGEGRDNMSCFIAMRDIEPNEELCISYIEGEDELKTQERQQALSDYLFVCACPRCTQVKPKKKIIKKSAKK